MTGGVGTDESEAMVVVDGAAYCRRKEKMALRIRASGMKSGSILHSPLALGMKHEASSQVWAVTGDK